MKRIISALLIATISFSVVGCNSKPAETEQPSPSAEAPATTDTEGTEEPETPETSEEPKANTGVDYKVAMITDVGGVSDQSFNQSAWEGLQKYEADGLGTVSYIESHQDSDYAPNIETKIDEGNDLIWGIGFLMGDAVSTAANMNTDQKFAIIDSSYEETPANLTGVMFKAHEPSFLVGYMAGKTTKTNKVGFIGGIKNPIIEQFEYGFVSGVALAAKELNKEIEVDRVYANSFADATIGKANANTMYTNGSDIIFHAAGGVGIGVITAAQEANKLVIGVDLDQSALAPDHVMSSAMKFVGKAMYDISSEIRDGKDMGGQTVWLGIKEGACGIPPYEGSTANLVEESVYNDTKAVEEKIISGEIVVPSTEAEYLEFIK